MGLSENFIRDLKLISPDDPGEADGRKEKEILGLKENKFDPMFKKEAMSEIENKMEHPNDIRKPLKSTFGESTVVKNNVNTAPKTEIDIKKDKILSLVDESQAKTQFQPTNVSKSNIPTDMSHNTPDLKKKSMGVKTNDGRINVSLEIKELLKIKLKIKPKKISPPVKN